MQLKIVKGTRDFFGEKLLPFQFLEKKMHMLFQKYGFQEIRFPILEYQSLFAKAIGEETDIVGKEMYSFPDSNDDMIVLRPEGTASAVRLSIQNAVLKQNKTFRAYYTGPMFRKERPQKGRYRQFYQIGAEFFGEASPYADVEVISMLINYIEEIGLPDITLEVNSIGCGECRPAYQKKLQAFFTDKQDLLCEDCQRRLTTNPLRLLDCKKESCRALSAEAPKTYENLCQACFEHFDAVQAGLQAQGIQYELKATLVRGLDYYSRTVFEVTSNNLGSQSAVGGGGRFDYLFSVYGEKETPAVGFALGMDRLALLLDSQEGTPIDLFFINDDQLANLQLIKQARNSGFSALSSFEGNSIKSQMRQANKVKARFVIIQGERETQEQTLSIKNMETGEQTQIAVTAFAEWLEQWKQ